MKYKSIFTQEEFDRELIKEIMFNVYKNKDDEDSKRIVLQLTDAYKKNITEDME